MKNLLTAKEIEQAKVTLEEYNKVNKATDIEKELDSKILTFDTEADDPYDNEDWNGVIEIYTKALDIIPSPEKDNGHFTFLHDQISGMYKKIGNKEKEIEHLIIARDTRKGSYDSGIMFKLGAYYLDEGEQKMALKHFIRAWDLSEGRIFIDEDSKYERFLKEHYEAEELY